MRKLNVQWNNKMELRLLLQLRFFGYERREHGKGCLLPAAM